MRSSLHPEDSQGSDGTPSASKKRGRDASADPHDVNRAIQAMETTFITIHDLTSDANILYCSQSIADVLDWAPEDVVGRPCWDFFHPDEVSFAKTIHGRGVQLDKASVLNYCRIKNKYGDWIGCECVFTVVYNVLIGCTSVYLDGPSSKKRAVEAPVVRQLFSSSPRDPRYHMLSYISSKFRDGPRPHMHEPRAALFLNRFTRTLTINFATSGLEGLLGIPAEQMQGKSFYYCIQENCLAEAVRCLESAKANDSIAYLRFWYRDPRTDDIERHDDILNVGRDSDSDEKEDSLVDGDFDASDDEGDIDEDDEDGGVQLAPDILVDGDDSGHAGNLDSAFSRSPYDRLPPKPKLTPESSSFSRQSSANTGDGAADSSSRMFDHSSSHRSSTPGTAMSLDSPPSPTTPNSKTASRQDGYRRPASFHRLLSQESRSSQGRISAPIELEAVISCTSDGLIVIMRAARPFVPDSVRVPNQPTVSPFSNGLFASPWAKVPILPNPNDLPSSAPPTSYPTTPRLPSIGMSSAVDGVHAPQSPDGSSMAQSGRPASQRSASSTGGPPLLDFMNSIRDVAVFAWALTGINGSLQQYGRGRPLLGAVPHSGLPVWQPDSAASTEQGRLLAGRGTAHGRDIDGGLAHEKGDGKSRKPRNDGYARGLPDGLPDGISDGIPDGVPDRLPDGIPDGLPDGIPNGTPDGKPDYIPDGRADGLTDGLTDGWHEEMVDGAIDGH